jgi:hypothetical protein
MAVVVSAVFRVWLQMITDEEWADLDAQDREWFEASPRAWFRTVARGDRRSRRRVIVELLNRIGGGDMARGTKKPAGTAQGAKNQWTTFVEIALPDEAWPDIQATYGTGDALLDAVTECVTAGHRVSVSYNGQNDTFNVSLTGKGDSCVNDGMTLVSFATTWFDALQVAMYKHHVIAEGEWSSGEVVAKRPRFG